MSRGLKVVADCLVEECRDKQRDAIALPGGMPGDDGPFDDSFNDDNERGDTEHFYVGAPANTRAAAAAAARPVPPLPAGWFATEHPQYKQTYYCNAATHGRGRLRTLSSAVHSRPAH